MTKGRNASGKLGSLLDKAVSSQRTSICQAADCDFAISALNFGDRALRERGTGKNQRSKDYPRGFHDQSLLRS
jgi:hypothetical protein